MLLTQLQQQQQSHNIGVAIIDAATAERRLLGTHRHRDTNSRDTRSLVNSASYPQRRGK